MIILQGTVKLGLYVPLILFSSFLSIFHQPHQNFHSKNIFSWIIHLCSTQFLEYAFKQLELVFDYKLSPCSECCMLSYGYFSGIYTSLRKGDSHLKHNSSTSTIPWLTPTRALSPSHTRPWPPRGSLHSTACFATQTRP